MSKKFSENKVIDKIKIQFLLAKYIAIKYRYIPWYNIHSIADCLMVTISTTVALTRVMRVIAHSGWSIDHNKQRGFRLSDMLLTATQAVQAVLSTHHLNC